MKLADFHCGECGRVFTDVDLDTETAPVCCGLASGRCYAFSGHSSPRLDLNDLPPGERYMHLRQKADVERAAREGTLTSVKVGPRTPPQAIPEIPRTYF